MPPLPSPCCMERGCCAREGETVLRRRVLGKAGPRLWRPESAASYRRTCAGCTRRQPYRPNVHRRQKRRVALSGAAQGGLRKPSCFDKPTRQAPAHRLLHHSRGSLRASGEQADEGRVPELPAVSPGRSLTADQPASCSRTWPDRVRRGIRHGLCCKALHRREASQVRARRGLPGGRHPLHLFLSSKPAKHLHGQAYRADV